MLYLAEVVQRKAGIIGGSKTELKLLACQRSEQSWSAVPGEETVPADDAAKYNPGALVLVELTSNKQVQRLQEAGRQLVSILQNFSRLQEKFRTQEEEIEQWKQSLTYQSQELNRREMEMESRREQLLQMEEDFEQLEQQRREVDQSREEITQLREESERNRRELEGAWEHLRGEMRRLEERQSEIQQAAVLDEDKARIIQDLLNRLSGSVVPTESVREPLNITFEIINQQQEILNQHWQNLEQQRASAQQLQDEVDRQTQQLQARWQEWHQAQESLEQARGELKAQQNVLSARQEYTRTLGIHLQNHEELHQQIYRLADASDRVNLSQKVDVESLEKMPLEELEGIVQELQRDLEKFSRFVNDQEEELTLKQQEIDELQSKMQKVSDYDRMSLETQMADEQDSYQMLNDTLVGQRRTLREREEVLNQHQSVMRRRQGVSDGDSQDKIDLSPILIQIDSQRQQQAEELHRLEGQVEQTRGAIQQAQGMVNSQSSEQENKRNELKQWEQQLQNQRSEVAQMWGRVNVYQETLQPIQDGLTGTRERLEQIASAMSQVQEAGDYQLQAIAEMRQILVSLMQSPQMAAS